MGEIATEKRPSWAKRILIGLAVLLLVIVLLIIGAVLWIGSSSGRTFVESTVEDMEFAGQRIALDGLDGSVLGEFTIDRMQLSGRDGVWLVAQGISVDWNPRAILDKTVDVDLLRVADLDVLAQPVLIPGEQSESEPRMNRFDIDGIDLPDVDVAEAVLGLGVNLRASGDLEHGPTGGSARIDATSDQGDVVDTDLAWSERLVLSGEADVEGPAGGLIANLMRLNPGQGMSADVSTQGGETTVLADIDGQDFATATVLRGQSSVSVAGRLQPIRLPLLDTVAPILGGETQFDVTYPLDTDARLLVDLSSPETKITAEGTKAGSVIAIDTLTLDVSNPLTAFDLDGYALERLRATGSARYDLETQAVSFDGQVDATGLRYADYAVTRLSGPAKLSFSEGRATFDTNFRGEARGATALANGARLIAVGTADLGAQTVALSRADIMVPGLSVQGKGNAAYGEAKRGSFDGGYDINTKVFRDGPSARLQGKADLSLSEDGLRGQTSGRATQLEGFASAVEPLLGEGVDYRASFRPEGDVIRVPSFTASNALFRASGNAVWQNGRIRADVDYSADRYSFAALDARGIKGRAVVTGPPAQIGFETVTDIQTVDAGALTLTSANVRADGSFSDGVILADVVARGDSVQGPVTTDFSVKTSVDGWELTGLNGTLGELQAEGTLSGFGGDIAALRADLAVSGRSPLVPAESIEAKVLISDARVDVDATLLGVAAGPLTDGTVKLKAVGPREAVAFDMSLDGKTLLNELDKRVKFRAEGTADLEEPGLSIAAPFTLDVDRQNIAGTLRAERGEDGWGGTMHAKGLGGAMNFALVPSADGRITFDADSLTAEQIMTLLGRPVAGGTVSGAGAFQLLADRIEGTAELLLNDLINPGSDAEPVSAIVTVALQNEQLRAEMRANEGNLDGGITLSGPVDTLPSAPFMVWPPATPLSGTADLDGNIGALAELVLPPQTDVRGRLDADLDFTVPPDVDRVQGTIALSEGVFEQGVLGVKLNSIGLDARIAGRTLTVSRFDARGSKNGTLSGSGQIGLATGEGSVDIRSQKLRIVDRREGHATVSGTLSLSRANDLLTLAGDLDVTDAEFNIARLPKPGLPTLEVRFPGEDDEEEEPSRFANQTTSMDLRIRSDAGIELTGRGLDARGNLDARITGPFNAPQISGEASIARGRFDFLSKRFVFRDSRIDLQTDVLQSRLSVEAVRETSDLTALVRIKGTVERPEIDLTAEPTLPEDEVLSRILFGRSPTQLSTIETARLAAALAQLSGGGGFDLLGSLENAIGLDTLDIGTNDTGKAQLTTGKYLSDDVYLEVRSSVEGTPGVAVEWQARRNVTVEAETVPGESQSVSVQWKKDFD